MIIKIKLKRRPSMQAVLKVSVEYMYCRKMDLILGTNWIYSMLRCLPLNIIYLQISRIRESNSQMKMDVTDMKRDSETIKTTLSDLLIDNPELQSNLNNLQVNTIIMFQYISLDHFETRIDRMTNFKTSYGRSTIGENIADKMRKSNIGHSQYRNF